MHFMKILTVYTLNSLLSTLKAHIHKMYVFCRPLKYLKTRRHSVDPDQTASVGAVWSGSTMFAYMLMLNNFQMQ